ncbi:MAG: MFS transporter [Proteobacteria bacterium]|nr:MFS transporter [Pseudomonadota bacterium]
MALNKKTLFYYGLTDLPVTMAMFPVLVFIPKFYTSEMAVPIALAATIMLAVRISDVITDPLFGYITDRFPTPWGRRRFWIVLATPILMLSIYQLFMPPEGAGAWHMGIWMFFLSIATTMMIIPYYAWAAELSPDYNERSKITGVRSMMGVVGSLAAQLAPAAALLFFGLGGSGTVLEIVGITMLIIMPICVLLTVTQVPEPREYVSAQVPIMQGLKVMFTNRPFLRLILAFMVSSTALSITTPLYLFFITYVLHEEAKAIYMLSFFYLANMSGVPFWVWLSTKIGKHRAYVSCFAVIGFAHPFYLLLGEGDFWYMLPITIVTGFAAGGFAALPNSMKADVIDLDTLQTGENRAALFFSTYSFTAKLAGSLGGSIGLFGLAMIGFNTVTPELNSPDQLFGLSFLFAMFPSLFYLTACAIAWNYPITEEKHRELREELEKKNRILSATDS